MRNGFDRAGLILVVSMALMLALYGLSNGSATLAPPAHPVGSGPDIRATLATEANWNQAPPTPAVMRREALDVLIEKAPVPTTPPMASLCGVVSMPDGSPAVGAAVHLSKAAQAFDAALDLLGGSAALAATDANGMFEVEDLPLDEYQICVVAPGAVPRLLPRIPLPTPECRDLGRILLYAGTTVRGRVFVDGKPAGPGDAIVELRGEHLFGVGWGSGDRHVHVPTDALGVFELPFPIYPSAVELCSWLASTASERRQQQATQSLVRMELSGTHVSIALSISSRAR